MIHIAIVDNDALEAKAIEAYLLQYQNKRNRKLKITYFSSGFCDYGK